MSIAALVAILLFGLLVRLGRNHTKQQASESSPASDGNPPSVTQEAIRLIPGVGVVYEYRGDFDRDRMVQMLREQGHIDEARARELLRDA